MSMILEPCRWTYLAGKLLPAERAHLPVDSHALHYGTAAFESLRLYATPFGARIVALEQHLDRLEQTIADLKLSPVERSTVRDALLRMIAANNLEEGYLRLLVYPSGNCTRLDPTNYQSDILIVGWKVNGPRFAPPLSLGVAEIRRPIAATSLPRAKHSGLYGVYASSHSMARAEGYDDALVLHTDGTVCEVTGANIFLVKDSELATPLIPDSIDGITRKLMIDLARSLGLSLREEPLTLDAFRDADEIFLTGTFHGLRPVSSIDGSRPRNGAPGPVTRALQESFSMMLDSQPMPDDRWLTRIAPLNDSALARTNGHFKVRPALREDIPAVLDGIRSLLEELRGVPGIQLPQGATHVCERIIDGRSRGAIYVAAPTGGSGRLIGVLSLNVLEAIHFGGPYALIQDLWVAPEHRSDGVGAALIIAAEGYCREHKLANMEVCLPSHRFPRLPRTHHFYQTCGFVELGPRMRKEVA